MPLDPLLPHKARESSRAGEPHTAHLKLADSFSPDQLHSSHGFNTGVGKAVFLAGITLVP